MPVTSNQLATTVAEVLSASIEGVSDLLVVEPPRDVVGELVGVLDGIDEPPPVRLFADAGALRAATEEFVTAATAADLIESGALAVRTLETTPQNTLLVSSASVVALIDGPGGTAGLSTTDEAFVAATYEAFDERWEGASAFSVRTPPLSRVRRTLGEEIGPDASADFDRAIEAVGAGEGPVDEIVVSLLVAARNGALLYDVSKWGEDVGLASKATFSRTKTRLEEAGLVDTEKVPIDVGRPRLRLRLPDRLADVPVDGLVDEARARL